MYQAWVDLTKYASETKDESLLEFIPQRHLFAEGPLPEFLGPRKTRALLWRIIQTLFANTILMCLVAIVIISTVALFFFRIFVQRISTEYGGYLSGIVNAFTIAILDSVYTRVALMLNNWENYRTKTEFEDKLILKIFCFQFVNGYSSLFYIAFFKGRFSLFGEPDPCIDSDGNETDSCMNELTTQLSSLLIVRILLGNFVELGFPYITSKLSLCYKYFVAKESSEENQVLSHACGPEKQATMPIYSDEKVSGALYDYLEIAIQLGLVTLFAAAFPWAPLIAWISNVIEGWVDGYKLFTVTRKPFYQGAQDLGSWEYVFRDCRGDEHVFDSIHHRLCGR